jgi:hypothetical protein
MPFWHFFGATLLGKGIVKVNFQVLVCPILLTANISVAISYRFSVVSQQEYPCLFVLATLAQSLFFVALFRRATRERILGALERLLPQRIPGLQLQRTPAEELHGYIERSIVKFQVTSRVADL